MEVLEVQENNMKENIKVGEKWVYVKCSKCKKKKDFSKENFNKKCGLLEQEDFAKMFVCASCLKKDKVKEAIEKQVINKKDNIDDDYFAKQ